MSNYYNYVERHLFGAMILDMPRSCLMLKREPKVEHSKEFLRS
jgi:hypothetical protein